MHFIISIVAVLSFAAARAIPISQDGSVQRDSMSSIQVFTSPKGAPQRQRDLPELCKLGKRGSIFSLCTSNGKPEESANEIEMEWIPLHDSGVDDDVVSHASVYDPNEDYRHDWESTLSRLRAILASGKFTDESKERLRARAKKFISSAKKGFMLASAQRGLTYFPGWSDDVVLNYGMIITGMDWLEMQKIENLDGLNKQVDLAIQQIDKNLPSPPRDPKMESKPPPLNDNFTL